MLERIITALVLVAVVLSCMFAVQSHYPMYMLMIIAAGVAGYEWFKLMPRKSKNVIKPFAWGYGLVTAVLSCVGFAVQRFCIAAVDRLYFHLDLKCLLGEVISLTMTAGIITH